MTPQVSLPARPARTYTPQALIAVLFGALLVLAQAMAAQARGAPESFADLAEKISPFLLDIVINCCWGL